MASQDIQDKWVRQDQEEHLEWTLQETLRVLQECRERWVHPDRRATKDFQEREEMMPLQDHRELQDQWE